ncbi:MAG: GvpL/GvpF family gas vesicle protein [Sphingomonadales bacterium]|nr:GvpL/GvpF family gas vesicle protein [Sphingomonadales bacterium]
MTKPLIHVFGIVRVASAPDLSDVSSDGDAAEFGTPRLIACGELAALVGDITLPNAMSLDQALADTGRAEELVLHHHRVLEALIRRQTVLPLRFGAVFADKHGLKATLRENRRAWTSAIDRIEGAIEWGLKIYCSRERMARRLARESPAIARLREEISRAADGRAFFLRRRAERLAEAEIDRAIDRCLDQGAARLLAVARGSEAGKIQPAEVHGREGAMVFNGAYLVDRSREHEFFEAVGGLSRAYGGFGIEYETTGPWPPYSFADRRPGGRGHAA